MKPKNNKHAITPEILRLINQAIADTRGSKAAFCRQSGISPYNLSKILSGNKKHVFGDLWDCLCDFFPEIDDRPRRPEAPPADPFLQIVRDNWQALTNEDRGRVAGLVLELAKKSAADTVDGTKQIG